MVKNQHYVPRLYLKNFCNSIEKIAVFDKTNQKSFYTSIINVANENYFYDNEYIDNVVGVNQFFENYFHPLEDKIAVLLRRLIESFDNGNFILIDNESRMILSLFLYYQFVRTKEYRERVNQTIKLFTQEVVDGFIKAQCGNPNNFEIVTDDKILHTNMLLFDLLDNKKVDEFAEILYNHIWIFLDNTSSTEFSTSDQPFVKKANIHHPIRSFSGLKSKGIEIAFPISPKYCLLLAERNFFKMYECFDGKLMKANYENVIYYNSLQIVNSYRFIFARENDFEMAKDMIKDEPEIANPNRVRIGIHKS